ncbi:hypothetical protein WH43_13650 [Rheinheimera sp. KL1]|uniref:hypothetical protein n=1 Tax=Rheinheimera sp. KL1 TaxID=1635005 RepID=UPI0006A95663|nr:hypothetical protein [Rheinheimera sp. KL1]KOO57557.1 hypothetical protein WH43_13650 [Rheinheimera sp. KL1]
MRDPIRDFTWLPAFAELTAALINEQLELCCSVQTITSLEFCDLRVIKNKDQHYYLMPLGTFFQLHDSVDLKPVSAQQYAREFSDHNAALRYLLNDLLTICSAISPIQRVDLLDRLFLKNRRGQLPILRNPELLAAFRLKLGLPVIGYVNVGILCEKLGLSDQSRSLKNHRHYRSRGNRVVSAPQKIGQQGAAK